MPTGWGRGLGVGAGPCVEDDQKQREGPTVRVLFMASDTGIYFCVWDSIR